MFAHTAVILRSTKYPNSETMNEQYEFSTNWTVFVCVGARALLQPEQFPTWRDPSGTERLRQEHSTATALLDAEHVAPEHKRRGALARGGRLALAFDHFAGLLEADSDADAARLTAAAIALQRRPLARFRERVTRPQST